MANTAFLGRGRTTAAPTVQTAPPSGAVPGAAGGGGVLVELQSGFSDAMRGRVSLLFLNSMILALVAFYVWTRRAQGGG